MKPIALLLVVVGVLGPASASAQEEVKLTFGWPEDARWRVITQWELELLPPDGQKQTRSGVLRETWDFEGGTPKTVAARQAILVRATPRTDADVRAIATALSAPWTSTWGAPPPAPEPPRVEDALGEEPATDGTVPVEAPAPVAAPGRPDLGAFVVGDHGQTLDRVFGGFAGQTLAIGRDVYNNAGLVDGRTGETIVADVVRRVDPLQWCADVGPGSHCVEVGLRVLEGGAPAEGSLLSPGARRTTETWVVEPGTLVPHAARQEEVVAWVQDGGTWRARVTRSLSFLPADPPKALR